MRVRIRPDAESRETSPRDWATRNSSRCRSDRCGSERGSRLTSGSPLRVTTVADSFIPDRAAGATPAPATEFDRLYRLIEGLLDADILLPEEGGALLEALDRARRCHREGDREAAHRQWLRLGLAIQSLVENGRLEEAYGRAALALVRQTPSRE
jgi:hypothetical protein